MDQAPRVMRTPKKHPLATNTAYEAQLVALQRKRETLEQMIDDLGDEIWQRELELQVIQSELELILSTVCRAFFIVLIFTAASSE